MCLFGRTSDCINTVSCLNFTHLFDFSNISLFFVFIHRENARLKSIQHNYMMSHRQSSKYFSVSIPRVSLQRRDGSNKKYFAYEIRITPASGEQNESWSLLRRYSEFHRLDKYLQKSNPVIKTLDFPPKKSFGNMVRQFHCNNKYSHSFLIYVICSFVER